MENEPKISMVLMVKDERHNMEPYFKNIEGVADELVVVDTGSTDGTLELIESLSKEVSYPVRVFHLIEPKFHDGKTRAYANEQCRYEYVLQLDADELLSDGFKANIRAFLRDKKPIVATIPREDELLPHFIDIMDYRLYKRESDVHYATRPQDEVHPHLIYSVTPIPFAEVVYHMQGKNHWLRRPNRIFGQLSREIDETPNTHGFARELARGVIGFFYKFRKIYFTLEARKDGKQGFKFAFMKGFYVLLGHIIIGLKPRTPAASAQNAPTT